MRPAATRTLLESVRQKARDSVEAKQRFFAENGDCRGRGGAKRSPACIARRGRLFTMGNGGSSCDAAHFAVEFLHPVTAGRPALTAINLTADIAMLTAVGNDVGFGHVFVRQVIAQAEPGDGLVGFSTSGNSENLLAAFAKAKEIGLVTIGFAGNDGGKMARDAGLDHCLVVRERQHPPDPGDARGDLSHPVGSGAHAAGRRPRWLDERGGVMKYVDEFRDPVKAQALLARDPDV